MSEIKPEDASPLEGGESSDQSLSDSWTVLDSSHFKEDGDLSDAESVEVLASEELPVENIFYGDQFNELASSCSLTTSTSDCTDSTVDASTFVPGVAEAPAASTSTAAAEDDGDYNNQEDNICTLNKSAARKRVSRKRFLRGYWNDVTVKAFGENLGRFLFEISLYSLVIDLAFLTFFGLSSLSCLVEQSGYSLMKTTKSYQKYEMDPLSLQLSHVLAEWKKRPQEDHSLDRHLLKTLFLYFGGSTELSANLHALTERVQKHNEAIRRSGNEDNTKIVQHHRLVVSGHLAHSVACILGKQDNDKSLPAELFTTVNNSSDVNSVFAPEPGFWLNDWHLPQYFKANDTYYRIDTKPVLPPMRNLFLHLGSAKWNHYFWKLYHQDESGNNYNNEIEIERKERSGNEDEDDKESDRKDSNKKTSENELEREETERSPLDLSSGGDFVSVEESSGNVNFPENPEERVGVLYPLFVSNLHLEESVDEVEVDSDEEVEDFGSYFQVLDGGKYFSSDDNLYECLDAACWQFKPMNDEQVKEVEISKKSKLSELFDEKNLEKQQNEKPFHDLFDEYAVKEEQELERVPRMSNENTSSEPQKEKKTKLKVGKRKKKYVQSDSENFKGKSKQKKRNKRKLVVENNDFNGKKKSKLKDSKKKSKSEEDLRYIQLDEKILREPTLGKKRLGEERFADWNTRMALGREKLRALSEKGNDQIWVFERARARRDLREETFSE